jgi:hypothetical protein
MPIYTLQGPDGKTYEVDGPEGATADQLGVFIQQNLNAPKPNSASTPAKATSSPGVLASLGAGLGHGFGEGMLGLQQAFGNLFGKLVDPQAGQIAMDNANQGIKSLNTQYAPYQTANPVSASAGNLLGMVAPIAAGGEAMGVGKMGAAVGDAAKSIPYVGGLLGPVANGAAQGALYGSVSPVESGNYDKKAVDNAILGSYLGGGANGLLSGALSGVKAVGNTVAPLLNPQKYVGSGLAAKIGNDAGRVLDNIQNAPTFVPGSMPSAAQAGAHPVLVATEKALGNASGDFRLAQEAQKNANNAARWDALMGVAKTPDELSAASAARADAVEPLYDAAHGEMANVGRGFIGFAQRPAVQKAMQLADQLAQNEGITLKWPTPDDRSISGHALDYTRRALGDMIDSAKQSGNKQQARALTQSRDYLTSWMNQYIPGMQAATQKYAEMSVPVNTMQAGQDIANAIGNKAMDSSGIPSITLPGFKGALDRAIKNQPFGIDPAAHQVLQGIGQDLQRASISNSLRSPGSDTAYNIASQGWLARNLFGPTFNGATNLGRAGTAIGAGIGTAMTGHPWTGMGVASGLLGGMGKLGQWTGGRLQSALGDILLDPQLLSPYLKAQMGTVSRQATPNLLGAALQRELVPAVSILGPSLLD